MSDGQVSPPAAASQSTSALDAALKPKAFQRQTASDFTSGRNGGVTGGFDRAPQSTASPVERALMPSMANASASAAPAPSRPSFDGKNWQGVASTTDGGDFSRLSGFNSQKFGDLGNATGDAMTSKYVFGRVASKYDPADKDALPKIVAELNSMGIPAQYDGKDGIDFGDGYGYIDVQQAWRPEGGGGPFDWMPKGVGGQSMPSPLQNAILPGAADGGINIQSLLASGAVDENDPLWQRILKNLQQGTQ